MNNIERRDKQILYITDDAVLEEQKKLHGATQKAVEKTISICTSKDILREYLNERKVEVMDIMKTLFDQDAVTERHEMAMKKQFAEDAAQRMIDEGVLDNQFIAKISGLSVKEVENIRNLQLV